jgi:hypothetical protein
MQLKDIETGSEHYKNYRPRRSSGTVIVIVFFAAAVVGTLAVVWSISHSPQAPAWVP